MENMPDMVEERLRTRTIMELFDGITRKDARKIAEKEIPEQINANAP